MSLALVTGGGSGIGFQLARQLARRSYALLLAGIDGPQLDGAAQALRTEFAGLAVQTHPLDLGRPEAAQALYDEVQRRGLTVDVLINNAGIFFYGDLLDTAPQKANTMLQLHMVTPTLLTRLFAADMKQRGGGHILFVSSISAWAPFPGIALYASTKRYQRHLVASLRGELAPWKVNVTLLAPGATDTPLYDGTTVPIRRAAKLGVASSAEYVARKGVDGLLKRRAVVIPGLQAKLSAWAVAVLPAWLLALSRRFMWFLPQLPR